MKADDLLKETPAKDEPEDDPALKGIGKRRPTSTSSKVKVKDEVKDEPMDYDLDFDDFPREFRLIDYFSLRSTRSLVY